MIEREKTVRLYLNRPESLMHDASASEPMITVRPARLVMKWCGSNLSFPPNTLPSFRLVRNLACAIRKDSGQAGVTNNETGMTYQRHHGASNSAGRTLFQDRPAKGLCAVKRPGKCVQLLVVYYQRKQSEQRVERELQQWQRQQQQ